ncbi:hypothetical protein [uncultured Maribacter sp.]|uniref:hypothetical protein n=1 Tax=uncultured Maribacter sp. TaxID=431308 RepID=UPI00260A6688|nr:hypothetical protein [uncultured Maribacter sp.]
MALIKKENAKQKGLAIFMTESKRQFAPVLFIAQPLPTIMKNLLFLLILLIGFTNIYGQTDTEKLISGVWFFEEKCDFRTEEEKSTEFKEMPFKPIPKGYPKLELKINGQYHEYQNPDFIEHSGKWKIEEQELVLLQKMELEIEGAKSFETQAKSGYLEKIDGEYYLPIKTNIKKITDYTLELGNEKLYEKYRRK